MFNSPCRTRMTSLTFAIVFAIALAVMTGKAQETTESLFLDTTLFPAVELSIKNTAHSSKVEINPSSSTQDASNTPKATTDVSYDATDNQDLSVVETTMASFNDMSTIVMDHPQNSLHGASVYSDLTFETVAVGLPSSSVVWDTALKPSFTTAASHSVTKLIPVTVQEDASTNLEISESSKAYTPDANGGGPNLSSYTAVEKSSSDMQLNGGSEELGISSKISGSESVVIIPNTEFVTPTSWYVFETESTSNDHNVHYGNETAVASTSPNATSTETDDGRLKSELVVSSKTQQGQRNHDMFVYPKRLGFVLKQRCNDDNMLLETFERLNRQLTGMLNSTTPPHENRSAFLCERVFHLTVPVKNMTDSVIEETIKNITKNFTFEDNFWVEKIYLYQNEHTKVVLFSADAAEQTVNNFDEYTLSERELIAYIVAGVSVATLIFILLTCCCVRFLCKKQTTSLDLCDIPHLNLKLEDYKLTPIPRPTISFSEYGRELFNSSYNEHTPKMEDTILSQQHFTADVSSPGARESMSFPREMRTFGGKKSCSRVQSLDARPNTRSGNGWMSGSREKLSTDFERRNSGFDNIAFRKWF